MELHLMQEDHLPDRVAEDLEAIGRDAVEAAFRSIYDDFKARGIDASGDVMPDEAFALDRLGEYLTRAAAVNIRSASRQVADPADPQREARRGPLAWDHDPIGNAGLVESAWYELLKGELMIVDDDGDVDTDLANTCANLWDTCLDFVNTTAVEQDDIEQYGARAVASRVAAALDIVWHGPHGQMVEGGQRLPVPPPQTRRELVVRYDVTRMTDDEIGRLAMAAAVQGNEPGDDYPAALSVESEVEVKEEDQ